MGDHSFACAGNTLLGRRQQPCSQSVHQCSQSIYIKGHKIRGYDTEEQLHHLLPGLQLAGDIKVLTRQDEQ